MKIDFKITCHLETEMQKPFESKKMVTAVGLSDSKIIFKKASFVQYEQFLLDRNFRQYIKTYEKILRMGILKTPIQKIYEISVGSDSLTVEF